MSTIGIIAVVLAVGLIAGLLSVAHDELKRIATALEDLAAAANYQARRTKRLDDEAAKLERRVRGDA